MLPPYIGTRKEQAPPAHDPQVCGIAPERPPLCPGCQYEQARRTRAPLTDLELQRLRELLTPYITDIATDVAIAVFQEIGRAQSA